MSTPEYALRNEAAYLARKPRMRSQGTQLFAGTGYLSSHTPGALTTVAGVPVSAQVFVRWRSTPQGLFGDGALVATTVSSVAGEWFVEGLNPALKYDVSARYAGENDALQSNVSPVNYPRFDGSTIQAVVGVALSAPLPIIGGSGTVSVAYVSGTYPAGVSLSGKTLTATSPTGTLGTYTLTYDLTDSVGTYRRTLDIVLSIKPLRISGSVPPLVKDEAMASTTFTAFGGEGPYTYAVSAGSLPAGLSFNISTGVLSGTPTAVGAYSFTITATDARSTTASKVCAGSVGVKHVYWRVYVTDTAGGGYGSMAELEFLDVSGVRCSLSGGAPVQSSNYSGYPASYAFDGVKNSDQCWAAASVSPPMWLGYQHASAVVVASVRITSRSATPSQSPKDFTIQSSDDGSTWTDE